MSPALAAQPRLNKDGRPRAARMTAAGRAQLELLMEWAPESDLDAAELYVRAAVATAPLSWLGEGLDAHLEQEACDIFEVDLVELYDRLHPHGPAADPRAWLDKSGGGRRW